MSWERPDPRRDEDDSVVQPLTSEAQRADKRPLTEAAIQRELRRLDEIDRKRAGLWDD